MQRRSKSGRLNVRCVSSGVAVKLGWHTEALLGAMLAKLGQVLFDSLSSHGHFVIGRIAWLELRGDLVPRNWLAHVGGDIVAVEEQKLVLVDCEHC